MADLDATETNADRRTPGRERAEKTRDFNRDHNGWVAPGFEEVHAEFDRNFAERGEVGAAVAAYWRGETVVDLWGGRRTPTGNEPWNEDTMVVVNSTTKGLAAMTVAIANSRGWIDYDAPVAEYWPEFAQNGKGAITVRQLLSHEAGLVWIDESLHLEDLHDLDAVSRALARQKPAWEPGTRHGYHAMTIGLYMQELIRHVDPAHRTLGRFFDEEIARPLQIEFDIGLPPAVFGTVAGWDFGAQHFAGYIVDPRITVARQKAARARQETVGRRAFRCRARRRHGLRVAEIGADAGLIHRNQRQSGNVVAEHRQAESRVFPDFVRRAEHIVQIVEAVRQHAHRRVAGDFEMEGRPDKRNVQQIGACRPQLSQKSVIFTDDGESPARSQLGHGMTHRRISLF